MEREGAMPDDRIVELYWQRDESAIRQTADAYGDYCHYIAYNILHNREDAEESVNDTWLDAWNSMPPHKPSILSTFLGKITRRISIDRWRRRNADKRGGGQMPLVWDELADCIADPDNTDTAISRNEMARIIRDFLDALPLMERRVFLKRYWFMAPIADIAKELDVTKSKITSMLHRTRRKLRDKLESEGYA